MKARNMYIPMHFRAQAISEELQSFIPSTRHQELEEYLCQLEAWEDFTREQSLEYVWQHRDQISYLLTGKKEKRMDSIEDREKDNITECTRFCDIIGIAENDLRRELSDWKKKNSSQEKEEL